MTIGHRSSREIFLKSSVQKLIRKFIKIKHFISNSINMSIKRGALIVFEGCDRAGKTTQCKKLVERLKNMNIDTKFMNFPNRLSQSGKIIDEYLKKKADLSDEAVHLLFTANRWEAKNQMERELNAGRLKCF